MEITNVFLLMCALIILIDSVYLYVFSNSWKNAVLQIQHSPLELNLLFTILSYAVLCIGLFIFVWLPHSYDLTTLQRHAVVWGLCMYGLFNFTNAAIFKAYPIPVLIQDTVWGGFLSLSVMTLLYKYVQ